MFNFIIHWIGLILYNSLNPPYYHILIFLPTTYIINELLGYINQLCNIEKNLIDNIINSKMFIINDDVYKNYFVSSNIETELILKGNNICLLYNNKLVNPSYSLIDKNIINNLLHSLEDTSSTKIIIATNIFESSITLKNVKYILNFANELKVIYKNFFTYIYINDISFEQTIQREGRTGRTNDGYVYYPFTFTKLMQLKKFNNSKIVESDNTMLILSILINNNNVFQTLIYLYNLISVIDYKQILNSLYMIYYYLYIIYIFLIIIIIIYNSIKKI